MRATENNQGSFLNRISIRRNQVVSMDNNHEQELEDIELFQKHVGDRFADLLSPSAEETTASSDGLLSIAWLRKVIDVFLCCEAEFKAIMIMGRDPSQISKPPFDRLLHDLIDRVVKTLDVCNAVTHGVDAVRHFQKLAEIAVSALQQRPIGDGQVRRAKKALTSLTAAMALEDKDGAAGNNKSTERAWSFGRRGGAGAVSKERNPGSFKPICWNMAKGWSASKQIQAMSSNLVAPRGGGETMAVPVYISSMVMVFVMWALVAAIPCQERNGLASHFSVPRQLSSWAQSLIGLQEKISEEWKKKEKRGCSGLLEEMMKMEKLAMSLTEFAETFQFPAEEERLEEVANQVAELAEICRKMEDGLVPLQQQLREVFHRVVRSRAEILDVLEQGGGKSSTPIM